MTIQLLAFYVSAAILLFAALRVITARNPVHAALWLVLAFFTAAGLWLLLYAEFLAVTLVLVYVGAVMVLFLFVVMMLDVNFDKLREGIWRHLPLAGSIGFLMALEMTMVVASREFGAQSAPPPGAPPAGYSNTKELGRLLYTDYVFPFELAAVVLLVAIVAAIALTLRRRKETRYQDPTVQLAATKAGRLKIRHRGGRHLPQPEEPDRDPHGHRADAALGEHELHRLLAFPRRPLGAGVRVLHPHRGRGGIRHRPGDPRDAVPQPPVDRRRRPGLAQGMRPRWSR
jgi:NADH-quinone oxidoreductase subunit J